MHGWAMFKHLWLHISSSEILTLYSLKLATLKVPIWCSLQSRSNCWRADADIVCVVSDLKVILLPFFCKTYILNYGIFAWCQSCSFLYNIQSNIWETDKNLSCYSLKTFLSAVFLKSNCHSCAFIFFMFFFFFSKTFLPFIIFCVQERKPFRFAMTWG